MAEIIKTTFQLRRGKQEAWERNNPVLAPGEPSFVTDKNLLKIGDGKTAWIDLPYIGTQGNCGGVYNAKTHYDFPSIGFVDMIYKAEDEAKIYQWDAENFCYEVLSEIEITMQDVEIIHGGNANGTT